MTRSQYRAYFKRATAAHAPTITAIEGSKYLAMLNTYLYPVFPGVPPLFDNPGSDW